jgi:DNA repair protein RecO (recombination protein O)
MPLKHSEAVVLRTYPLREADLLVTFFTRAEGKLKGVAKSAKKSRKRFGGALEPGTLVRVYWEDRERQELARIDSCEVLVSPMSSAVDYQRMVAIEHVAEMLDEVMPDREANDAVFRLMWSVLQHIEASRIWMPVTYFELWMVRLLGFLPELSECIVCGRPLDTGKAWFHALADGLVCQDDKRIASSEMSLESRQLAAQMFKAPVEKFADETWPRHRGADLRRFLMQVIDRHLDRKLATSLALERLD